MTYAAYYSCINLIFFRINVCIGYGAFEFVLKSHLSSNDKRIKIRWFCRYCIQRDELLATDVRRQMVLDIFDIWERRLSII